MKLWFISVCHGRHSFTDFYVTEADTKEEAIKKVNTPMKIDDISAYEIDLSTVWYLGEDVYYPDEKKI